MKSETVHGLLVDRVLARAASIGIQVHPVTSLATGSTWYKMHIGGTYWPHLFPTRGAAARLLVNHYGFQP